MRAPQSYYVSPLQRCLRTAYLIYSNLSLPESRPFLPTVREFFREGVSIRTCDRRATRSSIHALYPGFHIDPSFTQKDKLWSGEYAETSSAQDARSRQTLDKLFKTDPHTIVSITTHSGEAASLLRILGHIPFSLSTGSIIPVLVKAETIKGKPPATTVTSWTTANWCTNGPPVSSQTVAPFACVCSDNVQPTTAVAYPSRLP